MSGNWAPSPELQALAAAACSDELTAAQAADLERLFDDAQACRWFRDLWLLQAELRFLARAERADAGVRDRIERQATSPANPLVVPSPAIIDPQVNNAISRTGVMVDAYR